VESIDDESFAGLLIVFTFALNGQHSGKSAGRENRGAKRNAPTDFTATAPVIVVSKPIVRRSLMPKPAGSQLF